jgi:hypothetical protein
VANVIAKVRFLTADGTYTGHFYSRRLLRPSCRSVVLMQRAGHLLTKA